MKQRIVLSLQHAEDTLRFIRLHSAPGDETPSGIRDWGFLYALEAEVERARSGGSRV